MRLNRGGLIACAVYTLCAAGLVGSASVTDVKTSVMLSSLAVFPAGIFWSVWAAVSGSGRFPFSVDSWLNSLLAYYLESLLLIYLIGWAASARTAAGARLRNKEVRLPDRPDVD
ncbi:MULTISPECIES: hypothetical protein [unclassified Bradyrhizobium]|uniref:hypothetical protein n=1 Tax=unclassified Bradyrhizobium TaxID=2631580 RepID=UPI0028E7D627|nr:MULTISPECIES: hypothetical protein [unclassified Bradyrhizobium]